MDRPALSARLIAPDALFSLPALLMQQGIGARVLLVADPATYNAAGKKAEASLRANGYQPTTLLLEQGVEARVDCAGHIVKQSGGMHGLVAVGSGTVNDLTKYAAHEAGLGYVAVATAASMNGYSSATASLKDGGSKHSYAATPPRAVLADLGVIAAAPARLTRAGIGDSFCRSTVEADLLLSHLLWQTPYPAAFFARARALEERLISMPEALASSQPEALALLMELLLDGGDAMASHGSSAVASQGEHMIAHLLEARYTDIASRWYHGEQIAVTCLTMAALQEQLLGQERFSQVAALPPLSRVGFDARFGAAAEAFYLLYARKQERFATPPQMAELWPEIRAAVRGIMRPAAQLRDFFGTIGLATEPEELGLARADYDRAVRDARFTRDRFTFLDLQPAA